MKQAATLLVVDDNPDVLLATRLLLKQHYERVLTLDDPHAIEATLAEHAVDVVLLDMNFSRDAISGQEGFYWLKQIHALDPAIAVILMTAYSDVQRAVEAIKCGATDFLSKPWQNEQLLTTVATALNHGRDKRALGQVARRAQGLSQVMSGAVPNLLGHSKAMLQVFDIIAKAAQTDANILISGESGTGKELTAHAIHQQSLRAKGPFIGLDMGALSGSLMESELFGHKKGAFTDARADRVGRFELASGGTLFLDEIGNLPLEQQVKLLAALQNRQVTPVGGNKPIHTDIRLICATNEALPQAVADGRFRQDLLYRINTIEIRLPPLRERPEDIELLANHYLEHFGRKYRRELRLQPSQLNELRAYPWPGNVRELSHAIERAVILADGDRLDTALLFAARSELPVAAEVAAFANASAPVGPLLQDEGEPVFDLERVEHHTIASALRHFQGNVSHAAKALGLTRGALYRRMEKYGL
ncbi:sigma-54 dependent transcriptional regulator [Shewanella sp. JM162201]|uniref:Sigma-54 dependent transcriptional regulator n=1 Tax=Shewanella jiangmenensis TaxID=2837387 RepID=A0ABS5V929_9GAMM|nr:sigma-54 dependent transcriptional regulator [Shewanella jiangmenensis]MBT1446372.1 sigma-54 dependent transcriptional regulator [Shewanella jiangmenensis]